MPKGEDTLEKIMTDSLIKQIQLVVSGIAEYFPDRDSNPSASAYVKFVPAKDNSSITAHIGKFKKANQGTENCSNEESRRLDLILDCFKEAGFSGCVMDFRHPLPLHVLTNSIMITIPVHPDIPKKLVAVRDAFFAKAAENDILVVFNSVQRMLTRNFSPEDSEKVLTDIMERKGFVRKPKGDTCEI